MSSDTRQLPTDRRLLAAYLPAEPSDTAVTRARAGVRRLDQLVADAAAALDEHERRARAAAVALADAAMGGDDLDTADLAPAVAERHALVEVLERLRLARSICTRREHAAQTRDPTQLAWVAACRQITGEWERAVSIEGDDARFAGLVAFTERHHPG